MNLLAPKRSKYLLSFLTLLFLYGCQSPLKVFKTPPEQPEAIGKHSNGFFYRLPKVAYTLQVHAHRISKKRGELQDFSHLMKMPVNRSVHDEAIVIDSLNMLAKAYPDATKQYFVSVGDKQSSLKSLLNGLPTNPEPKEHTVPVNLNHSDHVVAIAKSQSSEQKQTNNEDFDQQVSFQQNINKLLNLNDQLLGAVQGLSSDTTYQSDSVLRVELKQIRKTLEQYQGQIQELRTLFNTFEDRELGKRAQELSGILHRMVELKTALVGGKQDINYSHTAIAAMLKSLDSMISIYQQPFVPQNRKKRLRWAAHFTPEPDKKQFRFGLKQQVKSGRYYLEAYDPKSAYQASLKIRIKPQEDATTTAFHQAWQQHESDKPSANGLFYNIPAPAKLQIELSHDGKHHLLGTSTVSIPQLGDVSHLSPMENFKAVKIHPFYGSMESSY